MPRFFIRNPAFYDADAELDRQQKIVKDWIKGGNKYYRKAEQIPKPGVFLSGKDLAWFFVKILIGFAFVAYFVSGMFSLGGRH